MKYCRFCGTTESQFRISGKFGCEHCVTQFFDPIKSKPSPIPKSLIEEIEGIFTKSESKTKILMIRTRLTRNLSHSLFPFYDLKKEEVKRLLAENELMDFLDEETNSFFTEKDSMIRLYFGGEDHLRFEALRKVLPCESLDPAEAVDLAVAKRKKLKSLLRFIFKNKIGHLQRESGTSLPVLPMWDGGGGIPSSLASNLEWIRASFHFLRNFLNLV